MSEIEKGLYSLGKTPLKVVMRWKPAKINAKKKKKKKKKKSMLLLKLFFQCYFFFSTTEIYEFASFDG